MEFNNNNSFNPNMNPYFTQAPFVSDNFNPVFYNMNQPNTPGWTYPNQYNPYLQSFDYNFQNNFNYSQSQQEFTYPELNFQPPCPQFSQYSFLDFASYTLFLEPQLKKNLSQKRVQKPTCKRPIDNFRTYWPPQFHNIFKSLTESHIFKMIKHPSWD